MSPEPSPASAGPNADAAGAQPTGCAPTFFAICYLGLGLSEVLVTQDRLFDAVPDALKFFPAMFGYSAVLLLNLPGNYAAAVLGMLLLRRRWRWRWWQALLASAPFWYMALRLTPYLGYYLRDAFL